MYCEDTLFYGIDCNAFYEHYGDSAAGILDIVLWTLSWLKMNISGAAIMKGRFPELTRFVVFSSFRFIVRYVLLI